MTKKTSDEEDRYIAIGLASGSRVLLVVYCLRDNDQTIRIISARKATKKEREFYEEGI